MSDQEKAGESSTITLVDRVWMVGLQMTTLADIDDLDAAPPWTWGWEKLLAASMRVTGGDVKDIIAFPIVEAVPLYTPPYDDAGRISVTHAQFRDVYETLAAIEKLANEGKLGPELVEGSELYDEISNHISGMGVHAIDNGVDIGQRVTRKE